MAYYCARLLVVCLVNDGKPRKRNICDYPFVLFKADSYEAAFERALQLGKAQETHYKNHKGQMVRWAFVKVEQIKRLVGGLDGVEVGSLMDVWPGNVTVPYRKRFYPERNEPIYD